MYQTHGMMVLVVGGGFRFNHDVIIMSIGLDEDDARCISLSIPIRIEDWY